LQRPKVRLLRPSPGVEKAENRVVLLPLFRAANGVVVLDEKTRCIFKFQLLKTVCFFDKAFSLSSLFAGV
jgi:hypothetical protein